MGNYYFLSIYLPDLSITQKPDLSLDELKSLLEVHLNKRDFDLCMGFLEDRRGGSAFSEWYFDFLDECKESFYKLRSSNQTDHLEIKNLYENELDPSQLYFAFNEYKLKKIDEFSGLKKFTIDIIVAYLAKYLIISEIHSLNDRAGKQLVAQLEEGKI